MHLGVTANLGHGQAKLPSPILHGGNDALLIHDAKLLAQTLTVNSGNAKCGSYAELLIAEGMSTPERDTQMLHDLCAFTGFKPSRIAKEVGVAATTITRPFNGESGTVLSRPTLEKLRAKWPDFPGWPSDAQDKPAPNGVVQQFEGASEARMAVDLPILGTALGADRVDDQASIEQTYLYSDEVVGYAKRPVLLDGRADAYGIYVQGSSMDPVFEDGSLILVEGKRPPRIGDNVVVYLRKRGAGQDGDDGESARTVLVKRLVRRNASTVELEQHNPKLTFSVTMADVLKIHRVMTLADLLS